MLLNIITRVWWNVIHGTRKMALFLIEQEFGFSHLSYFACLNPPAPWKSLNVFISCSNLWKSPVTVSDSPMNNWGPLSVPTYPGTPQEGNKCGGQCASIKDKNMKDFGEKVKLLWPLDIQMVWQETLMVKVCILSVYKSGGFSIFFFLSTMCYSIKKKIT